jgi:hypothetical protein
MQPLLPLKPLLHRLKKQLSKKPPQNNRDRVSPILTNGLYALQCGRHHAARFALATPEMSMSKLENPILIGVVGAAQGIRGEVRVKPFTEDPMAIAEYGALYTEDGRRFEVLDHRLRQDRCCGALPRRINDRNAAEAIKGLNLYHRPLQP